MKIRNSKEKLMRRKSLLKNNNRFRAAIRIAMFVFIAGAFGLAAGCGVKTTNDAPDRCALLDSLFGSSGFGTPVVVEGKATVDANDYHMRGKIRLDARAPGDVVFEFASSILFGNRREDFLLSLHADTVRIIDRERGAYYEGSEAEEFLAESMGTDFGVPTMLFLALGGHPSCDELSDVRITTGRDGNVVCTGKHLGERFRVVFEGRGPKLKSAVWPVRSERYRDDRLEIDYRWEDGDGGAPVLKEIVMWLEIREWRCKIKAGS